jgi:hypothetical protein
MKKLAIGIIGPNKSGCSEELYKFGEILGQRLSSNNRTIICGGLGGFMEAVCKGTKCSTNTFYGQTIGILPDATSEMVNPYVDIVIPTGIGIARNIIIINSADIIIAAGGGAGTLSELAFAWQKKKRVLCVSEFGGWASKIANKDLDNRAKGLLIAVESISDILDFLEDEET